MTFFTSILVGPVICICTTTLVNLKTQSTLIGYYHSLYIIDNSTYLAVIIFKMRQIRDFIRSIIINCTCIGTLAIVVDSQLIGNMTLWIVL